MSDSSHITKQAHGTGQSVLCNSLVRSTSPTMASLNFAKPNYIEFKLNDRVLSVPLTPELKDHGELQSVWLSVPDEGFNPRLEYANLRVVMESSASLKDEPLLSSIRADAREQMVDYGIFRFTDRNGINVLNPEHLLDRHKNVRTCMCPYVHASLLAMWQ